MYLFDSVTQDKMKAWKPGEFRDQEGGSASRQDGWSSYQALRVVGWERLPYPALGCRQDVTHAFGQDQTCCLFHVGNQMAMFTARVMWKSRFPNARNVHMPGFSRQFCSFFHSVFYPQKSRVVRFYVRMPQHSILEATGYYFCVFNILDHRFVVIWWLQNISFFPLKDQPLKSQAAH